MSLDSLKFYQALSLDKFDSDLPLQFVVLSLAYVAALQAPAAIWAGAITPIRATAYVPALYSIPFYNDSLHDYWRQSCRPATSCSVLQNTTQLGTFTNVAWKCEYTFLPSSLAPSLADFCSPVLPGLLLNSVRDASSRNSSISQHKKLDNSGFSFHGRSYGVGAGVGLISPTTAQHLQPVPRVTNYTFPENGYLSHVNCIYNKSSNLSFEQLDLVQGGERGSYTFSGSVVVLQAVGSLPTGVWQGFTTMSIATNLTAVALAAVANDTHNFYGFLGGTFYADLNNIQCEATFNPTTFSVAVDVMAQNISVTPTTMNASDTDIDPTGGLIRNAFMGVSYLSQILTTMYTGVLGDAFNLNIDAVQHRENHTDRTKSDITTGLAESLELLLDEYLGSIAASQLIQLNQSQPLSTMMMGIEVVRLGEPVYAYISFFINLAIVGIFLFEAIRTRFWKNLPSFNCLDAKSAILGAAAGGREVSEEVRNWEGDAADPLVGKLEVMLRMNKPVLELLSPATGDESVPGLDSTVEAVPLSRLHSRQDMHVSQGDLTHLLQPGEIERRRFGWAIK